MFVALYPLFESNSDLVQWIRHAAHEDGRSGDFLGDVFCSYTNPWSGSLRLDLCVTGFFSITFGAYSWHYLGETFPRNQVA